jgi:hypothetical protein
MTGCPLDLGLEDGLQCIADFIGEDPTKGSICHVREIWLVSFDGLFPL